METGKNREKTGNKIPRKRENPTIMPRSGMGAYHPDILALIEIAEETGAIANEPGLKNLLFLYAIHPEDTYIRNVVEPVLKKWIAYSQLNRTWAAVRPAPTREDLAAL